MENEQIRHHSGMPTADELRFYEAAERAWNNRCELEGPDAEDVEVMKKMACKNCETEVTQRRETRPAN